MYNKLKDLPIAVDIYAPFGTPPEQITEQYLEENYHNSQEVFSGVQDENINKYWFLILYVIRKLNSDAYSLNVGRTIYQKICYLLTYVGIPTDFDFEKGNYGPYSSQARNALVALTNANLISEKRLGKMIEMVVNSNFKLDESMYSQIELDKTNNVYDLIGRIKSSEHAEIVATIIFSYDQLVKQYDDVTEKMIYDYIISWKQHWKDNMEYKILKSISELASMDWIHPNPTKDMLSNDDYI